MPAFSLSFSLVPGIKPRPHACQANALSLSCTCGPAFSILFFFSGLKKRETEVYVGNLPLDVSEVFLVPYDNCCLLPSLSQYASLTC
jgi:hypothetical protein